MKTTPESGDGDDHVKEGHTYVQWMVAILANLTLISYGFNGGWIMPMSKVLQSDNSPAGYPLSDYEISWIASSLCISAIFSVTIFSCIVDRYGRKLGVILIAVLQLICWIIMLCSASTPALITARLFTSAAAGGAYNIVPMYVREISHDSIRGRLGCLLTVSHTTGTFVIYLLGIYLDYYTVLWIVLWLPVITILLMLKAPESPQYLVKKERIDEAASTLAFLRGLDVDHKLIQSELDYMKNQEEYYRSLPIVTYMGIWKNKAWRRGFILIIVLVTLQMGNGNFAIVTYAGAIFKASGVTMNPELQSLSIPIVMMLSSLISSTYMEKVGRKPLLISTCTIAIISMTTLGTGILLRNMNINVPGWLAVICIIVYEGAYASAISTLPYVIMAEMFNFQIRARMMGLLVTHGWFVAFIQLFTFTPIVKSVGIHSAFYFFAGLNLIGVIITLLFLPETRGKTVEEIEVDLRKGKNI